MFWLGTEFIVGSEQSRLLYKTNKKSKFSQNDLNPADEILFVLVRFSSANFGKFVL